MSQLAMPLMNTAAAALAHQGTRAPIGAPASCPGQRQAGVNPVSRHQHGRLVELARSLPDATRKGYRSPGAPGARLVAHLHGHGLRRGSSPRVVSRPESIVSGAARRPDVTCLTNGRGGDGASAEGTYPHDARQGSVACRTGSPTHAVGADVTPDRQRDPGKDPGAPAAIHLHRRT